MRGKAVNFSVKTSSGGKAVKVLSNLTSDGGKQPATFQRIAAADLTAVRELVDAHGNLIWALAKKFTDSIEKAESATQEIFLDLWKYAGCFAQANTSEEKFIISVAYQCLIKRQGDSVSAAKALIP